MNSGFKPSKLSLCISLVISAGYQSAASAQTHSEEQIVEVVVTSAFQTSEAETAMPVVVLSAVLGRIPNMEEYKAAVEGIDLTKFAPPLEKMVS